MFLAQSVTDTAGNDSTALLHSKPSRARRMTKTDLTIKVVTLSRSNLSLKGKLSEVEGKFWGVEAEHSQTVAEHHKEMANLERKLSVKSSECRDLAKLCQDRRRGESTAMQMADERVHTMQLQVQEKMEESEAFARSTVLAERSHSSQVQFRRDKEFKKSMSEADNTVSHYREKAISAESKIKENKLKNAQMTSLRHHLHKKEIQNLKDKHMLVLSELKTKYQTLSVRPPKKTYSKTTWQGPTLDKGRRQRSRNVGHDDGHGRQSLGNQEDCIG